MFNAGVLWITGLYEPIGSNCLVFKAEVLRITVFYKSIGYRLSGKSRLYPTKAGSWTKNGIEKLSYSEWTSKFVANNAESRNRPEYGFMEMSHTLLLALPVLRQGIQDGVFGPVIVKLCDQIEAHKEALAQVDKASSALKTHESVTSAIGEVVGWLEELATKQQLKSLLPVLHFQGEVCRHISHQFAEWLSGVDDLPRFAASIQNVSDHAEAHYLKKFVQTPDAKRLSRYLAHAIAPNADHAGVAPVPEPVAKGAGRFDWDASPQRARSKVG